MTSEEFNNYLRKRPLYWCIAQTVRVRDRNEFSINDGWLKLLADLLEELHYAGWDHRIIQVKEKWGGLRLSIINGDEELWDIISKYEKLSWNVCERCCSTNDVTVKPLSGWFLTLCPLCRAELEKVRQQNAINNNSKQLSSEGSETLETDSTS